MNRGFKWAQFAAICHILLLPMLRYVALKLGEVKFINFSDLHISKKLLLGTSLGECRRDVSFLAWIPYLFLSFSWTLGRKYSIVEKQSLKNVLLINSLVFNMNYAILSVIQPKSYTLSYGGNVKNGKGLWSVICS